jgi:hypothetical protein
MQEVLENPANFQAFGSQFPPYIPKVFWRQPWYALKYNPPPEKNPGPLWKTWWKKGKTP